MNFCLAFQLDQTGGAEGTRREWSKLSPVYRPPPPGGTASPACCRAGRGLSAGREGGGDVTQFRVAMCLPLMWP